MFVLFVSDNLILVLSVLISWTIKKKKKSKRETCKAHSSSVMLFCSKQNQTNLGDQSQKPWGDKHHIPNVNTSFWKMKRCLFNNSKFCK